MIETNATIANKLMTSVLDALWEVRVEETPIRMDLYRQNKSVITRVFKELRKKRNGGFFAKQNFMTCCNIAVSAIPDETENWVYYHAQDTDNLKRTQSVFLAWKGDANKIVDLFKREIGSTPLLEVNWNGSVDTRIELKFKSQ